MLEVVEREAAQGVEQAPVFVQRGDIVAACRVFLADGGVEVQHGRLAQQVEPARHLGPPLGGAVGAGRDAYALSLQVELLHQLAHVQLEVGLVLFHLGADQVAVGACHAHLSLAPPPVQDGEGDAEADVLLVQGVAVGIAQLVARLGQAEAQVDVGLQSGVGAGVGHVALALQLPALHVEDVGAVGVGQQQGFFQVDDEVGDGVVHHHLQVRVLADAEVGTQLLHGVFHFDAGVHAVGFLVQLVHLQLQHFVLADGADVIASLRIGVEGVGVGVVGGGYFEVALCRGQVEELLGGGGGHQFQGLHIGLARLLVAHRLDAFVPLQAVVAEEALPVAHHHGRGLP